METKNRTKGWINALVSACTFGLIPLFSVPVLRAGMGTPSVMLYRFAFALVFILIGMLFQRMSLRITRGQLWRIGILAVLNVATALSMVWGYEFMPSGPACTIQFSYPVFTCLLMVIFFHEHVNGRTILAIILAVLGVAALSGVATCSFTADMAIGVGAELFAGFCYAVYLVLVPVFDLGKMPCLKLTFWVFALSEVLLLIITPLTPAGIQPISSGHILLTLILLGFVPTALSNFTLIVGLQNIGSTLTSILGALEPLTAMIVGVLVFAEPFTMASALGLILIITAVILLVLQEQPKRTKH